MNKNRMKAEKLIYDVMDILDSTKANSDYYKKLFTTMSDTQFVKFLGKKFPIRFQIRPFVIEPNLSTSIKALDFIGVPLFEPITLDYIYERKDGNPIWSKPCFVGYAHLKKMKQYGAKKTHMSTSISMRDMKSGQLLQEDKGARESDREFEALTVMGLDNTVFEFSKVKKDAMNAKSSAYSTINLLGDVTLADIETSKDDGLAKTMISAHMIAAHLYNNLVMEEDYMTPRTRQDKKRKVEREV